MNLDILDEISSKTYLQTIIDNEFKKSLDQNIFYINMEYLILNSRDERFKQEWELSPKKASLDLYSNQYLYKILLMVNNCSTISDFTMDNLQYVKAPEISAIRKLANSII